MGIVFTGKDCHPVTLPGCLADWIESHMPRLKGGVASVTFQCCDEVRVGFIFKGRRTGYTSGKNTIHRRLPASGGSL